MKVNTYAIRFMIVMSTLFMAGCCPLMLRCSDTVHIVRPGDTLEDISVQYYGSETHKRLILEANYLKEKGRRLKSGQRIKIPARRYNDSKYTD